VVVVNWRVPRGGIWRRRRRGRTTFILVVGVVVEVGDVWRGWIEMEALVGS